MPRLLETLLYNLDFDLEQVADVIDPILTAPNDCQVSGLYIQGVVVGDRCFVVSKLNPRRAMQATTCGRRWLIGHSSYCNLSVRAKGVAQFHAALEFNPELGFSLSPLSQEACTQVNGRLLLLEQLTPLQDGDVVQLGRLQFEFLQDFCPTWPGQPRDASDPLSRFH